MATDQVESNKIETILNKTKCKSCKESRDTFLEKVDWEKYSDEEVEDRLLNILCVKHQFTHLIMENSDIEIIKKLLSFHEGRSSFNYNEVCTILLPTLINQKTIHRQKSREFIEELVRYVLTAKGKLKKNLDPKILKKYMKNAPLSLEFWSQYKLDPKFFQICIENNYPYKETFYTCFKKSEAKRLFGYAELILKREGNLTRQIQQNSHTNLC